MGIQKELSQAYGEVHFALTFDVPLLVGRLVDEPLIVTERFDTLPQLILLLTDHKVESLMRAHAATEAQVIRVSIKTPDPNEFIRVSVTDESIKTHVQSEITEADFLAQQQRQRDHLYQVLMYAAKQVQGGAR